MASTIEHVVLPAILDVLALILFGLALSVAVVQWRSSRRGQAKEQEVGTSNEMVSAPPIPTNKQPDQSLQEVPADAAMRSPMKSGGLSTRAKEEAGSQAARDQGRLSSSQPFSRSGRFLPSLRTPQDSSRPGAEGGAGNTTAQQDAQRLIKQGDLFLADGRYGEALEAYKEAGKLVPGDARPLMGQGEAQFHLGHPGYALKAFDKALKFDSSNDKAYRWKADMLALLHKYAEARIIYDVLLRRNPDNIFALLGRGRLNMFTKQYDWAVSDCKHILRLVPTNVGALLLIGEVFLLMHQPENALQAFQQVADELEKDNALAWVGKGKAYQDLRNYQRALNSYRKALELEPANKDAQRGADEAYKQLSLHWGQQKQQS